jgi:caffeoyl-CoA O-methyltransferase
MTPRSFLLTPELSDYVRAVSEPPDALVTELLAETAAIGERDPSVATLQIAAEQGAFLQLLTAAVGARTAIEIGTFTGYSALCIARGLPADGSLLCLDVDAEYTAVGRRYWDRAGVGSRIELRIGDARRTLRDLPLAETYDLAFVDADKTGYPIYVDHLHPRMRPNGVVLLDNTLRRGRVLDPQSDDDRVLDGLNRTLAADPRWETVLLPVSDGLTLLRKR